MGNTSKSHSLCRMCDADDLVLMVMKLAGI